MASKAGWFSNLGLRSSHLEPSPIIWSSANIILKLFSSFLIFRFSSLTLSFSLVSAFSSSALYVSLTLPASSVALRLSSQTIVAKSSNVVVG